MAFALAVLSCLCFNTVLVAAERTLDIRPHVRTSGTHLRLREIVVDTSVLTEEQREAAVLEAPDMGAVTYLTLVDLAYRLQQYPSLLSFHLRGPKRIAIHGGVDAAFVSRCRGDLIKELEQMPPWDQWDVSVRFELDDERLLSSMDPDYAELVVKPRSTAMLLGPVELDVAFLDATGDTLSECMLQPTILRKVSVLMMTEACDRGQVLRTDDMRQTSIWVGADAQQYITDLAEATGSELNRRLNAGELLRSSHLSPPVCSRRGDLVKVLCITRGINISMSALALENGRLGETIRLRNPTSDVVFEATLNGSKSAVFQTP